MSFLKTLRSKILTGFILSITATFLILLYLVNLQIKNINIPLTEDLNQQIIDAKANEVGTWLYQRISELRVISENEMFKTMDMNKIRPYIRSLNKKVNSKYGNENETFAVVSLEGKGWINDDVTIDINNREYFQEALSTDKEFIISNPIISKSDSEPIVIIAYPIYNVQGKKVGFIDGAINLSKLSEIASGITLQDGVAWIMDGDGNIFTSKNGAKTNIKNMDYYDYKGFKEASENMLKGESGTHTIIKPDGGKAALKYASIPYAKGWSLGIIISLNRMYEDTNRLIHLIIIFGVILLIMSILISILFSSSVVKPIRVLQKLMAKVEDGNLNSYYKITGNDEIAQLGKSFNNMLTKINDLINKVYTEQNKKRKAEFQALQSQIKPHFLYNTLDTIQWKAIEVNDFEVADMITALSNLFRISISKGKEIITLGEEIDHIKSYLLIQKIRYEDILEYTILFDESLNKCKVLKLLIQPIVENAIYHGIKNKRSKGLIEISIFKEKNDICITVKDDGIGIKAEELKIINSQLQEIRKENNNVGFGLFNVNERIKLSYGTSYGVKISSIFGNGTEVIIKIPIVNEVD